MANSIDYLSLITALNSSNNVQNLYANYNPYSAASLYGNYNDSYSFSNIFGAALQSMQSSNTGLLTELFSSALNENSNNTATTVNKEDAANFVNRLSEASGDSCDCHSAELVKELYQAYLENTSSYNKNLLNQLITAIGSNHTATEAASNNNTSTNASVNTNTNNSISSIDPSVPTEEEIDKMIAASLSLSTT